MLISQFQKKTVNGRQVVYFQDRKALLAGVYPDIQTLDGAGGDISTAENVDFRSQMELLAQRTNNFFRFWVIFYPNFVNTGNPPGSNFPTTGYPNCQEIKPDLSFTSGGVSWRKRYSPFQYQDDKKKWDLTLYNGDYFLRLRKMIDTAADYGIVVQLTLFDRCGTDAVHDCSRWPYNPWNAANNVNQLIKDPTSGVNKFYDRTINGVSPGPPATPITLGTIQDNYVRQVLSATVDCPNVMYEIMNEPIHNPSGATADLKTQESLARAAWADEIVGVIHKKTHGTRLIFYNDHTFPAQAEPVRGQDIVNWKSADYGNYALLDGVTFHGDIKSFNPDLLPAVVRQDKIIQVSSDTHTDQSKEYNAAATRNAFAHSMMFQAEAIALEAADGIGSAVPPPTLLKLAPLVGKWVKLIGQPGPTNFPHLMHIQNADGTFADLNQDTDEIPSQGHVVRLDSHLISFRNDLLQQTGLFSWGFMNNGTDLLQFTANNQTQVYRRVDVNDPVWPLLGKWERTSVTPADSTIPSFFAFFYVDRSLVTRLVNNPATVSRLTLSNISPPNFTIHNSTAASDTVWKYTITNDGQQLTLDRRDPADPSKPSNPVLIEVFRRLV